MRPHRRPPKAYRRSVGNDLRCQASKGLGVCPVVARVQLLQPQLVRLAAVQRCQLSLLPSNAPVLARPLTRALALALALMLLKEGIESSRDTTLS